MEQSTPPDSPILVVPYMWIGDFVRCHTVVRLLAERSPGRPIDVLTTAMVAPLVDYMPGVRYGIVADLPRRRLAFPEHYALAERLRTQRYGHALIMPRTWKAALAPLLAGIPVRTGFVGEARFGLINDLRWGERALPRMVDRCVALAMAKDQSPPAQWPEPQLVVPLAEVADWRQRQNLLNDGRPIVALAPGAVGPSKAWPVAHYAELACRLKREGFRVWILGGPNEKGLAEEIVRGESTARARQPGVLADGVGAATLTGAGIGAFRGPRGPGERHLTGSGVRDLTGPDLRNAVLALAAADVAVSNDSGLLHVAAALGTPAVGIFGPTSPWHWAPLNPLAAVIETESALACRPCHKPACRLHHHRCMRDISVERVATAARIAVAALRP